MKFIDPRAKVFRHLDRLAGWRAGEQPAPVTVEWDLSNRCSLGCQDCHFAHTHIKGPWVSRFRVLPNDYSGTGDLADPVLVTRVLGELARAGTQGIVWSGGGEPTLHPKWRDLMVEAHVLGLQQGLYTLGGHLSEDDAAFLGSHLQFVVVSLDTIDAATYAKEKGVSPARFAQVLDAIAQLSAGTAAIGVSYLLHEDNWGFAPDMVQLSRQLGATYTTFRPAIRFRPDAPSAALGSRDWITTALPTLRELAQASDVEVDPDRFVQYRDWTGHGYPVCLGIRLTTTITPDGRVWVCPNRRGMADSCLGDLRHESFAAIWARHPAQFAVNDQCRVMCRLHPVNTTLHALEQPHVHEAFV